MSNAAAAASLSSATAPWRSLLQRSLSQNSSLPYAKYMQLASVRPDGRPAARTVVFRCVAFVGACLHLAPATHGGWHNARRV
jgi:hypothetical protein